MFIQTLLCAFFPIFKFSTKLGLYKTFEMLPIVAIQIDFRIKIYFEPSLYCIRMQFQALFYRPDVFYGRSG